MVGELDRQEERERLERSVRDYEQRRVELRARGVYQPGLIIDEAIARRELAGMGIEPQANLKAAITLYKEGLHYMKETLHYKEALQLPDSDIQDVGICLANEAIAYQMLAGLGIEAKANLESAVELCREARTYLALRNPDANSIHMYEADIRLELVGMGIEPQANLEVASTLYETASRLLDPYSQNFGVCLAKHAIACGKLADLGIEAKAHLETAVRLCREAWKQLDPSSPFFVSSLVNEVRDRLLLAELGVEAQANLEAAIMHCQEARQHLDPRSQPFGITLQHEGSAHEHLAELGVEVQANLEAAADLYERAFTFSPPGTSDWGANRRNLARTLRAMGRSEEAHALLQEALEVLERLRHQFHDEQESVPSLETISHQYTTIIALCQELETGKK